MTKIKICGLQRVEDAAIVNEVQPDYVGFVFAPSRRQVTGGTAFAIKEKLNSGIVTVGVFVDAPVESIITLCRENIIDVIQLHGSEDDSQIRYLKEYTGKEVIKALRVQSRGQVEAALSLSCDYLLLDTYTKGQAGGTGETFDLGILPEIEKPFFLAGGLSSANVRERISIARPYAVDVSSGVELNGYKDERLVREFVQVVRGIVG